MITVAMVREKGFEFVADDVIDYSGDELIKDFQEIIKPAPVNSLAVFHDCHVKEFAPRPNKGSMPCDGELFVDIERSSGEKDTGKAEEFAWNIRNVWSIKSWKPSLQNWSNEMNETQDMSTVDDVSEWKNGDECFYNDNKYTYVGSIDGFHGVSSDDIGRSVIINPLLRPSMICAHNSHLSKPETAEEKEARERAEALDEMLDLTRDLDCIGACEAIYDAGYRKESK